MVLFCIAKRESTQRNYTETVDTMQAPRWKPEHTSFQQATSIIPLYNFSNLINRFEMNMGMNEYGQPESGSMSIDECLITDLWEHGLVSHSLYIGHFWGMIGEETQVQD